MPGFNHYSDCTCGWCVKYGDSHSNASERFTDTEASRKCEAYGIFSHSNCFVDRNATCPVCGEKVYYYENVNGSKVYFDDLGPPWPKHRCTDNRDETVFHPISPTRPEKRPASEIIEIFDAAIRKGMRLPSSSNQPNDPWHMFVAIEVIQLNDSELVELDSVDPRINSKERLLYRNRYRVIEIGDFVFKRKSRFSFFDIIEGKCVDIESGDDLQHPKDPSESSQNKKRGRSGTPPGTFAPKYVTLYKQKIKRRNQTISER